MTRTLLTLASILVFGTLTSCVEPTKKYVSKDGKYSAAFPAAPKETTAEISAPPPLGNTKQFISSLDVKADLTFMVIYNDYPEVVTMAVPQKVLSLVRDGSKGPAGKVVSDGEIADANPPAREYVLERDGTYFRAHTKLAGTRLYQIIVVGRKLEDVTSKPADAFIQSFEIAK